MKKTRIFLSLLFILAISFLQARDVDPCEKGNSHCPGGNAGCYVIGKGSCYGTWSGNSNQY